jgi:hypothetical protein
MAKHLFKGAVDIGTIGLGFNRSMQRNRLKPVPPSIVQQWRDLQEALQQDPSRDRQAQSGSSEMTG